MLLQNLDEARQKAANTVAIHMVDTMQRYQHFKIVETLRICDFSEINILRALRALLQQKMHWQGFREIILENLKKVQLPFEQICREMAGVGGLNWETMKSSLLKKELQT